MVASQSLDLFGIHLYGCKTSPRGPNHCREAYSCRKMLRTQGPLPGFSTYSAASETLNGAHNNEETDTNSQGSHKHSLPLLAQLIPYHQSGQDGNNKAYLALIH